MADSKKLVQGLRAYAEWAEGNEYEVPLDMSDLLREAADALENSDGVLDAAARVARKYKAQRDAAVRQLRRIGDCDTCKNNRPVGYDPPECVTCTKGQAWKWDGGNHEKN